MKHFVIFISLILILLSCSGTKKSLKDDADSDKDKADIVKNELNPNYEEMFLMSAIESQSKTSITFNLTAHRLKFVENEYFPNSENFRVEIYSEKGILIWSSNNNKNYLMVIGKVLPEKVGDIYNYKMSWTGVDNNNKPAGPGNYYARLTIPALPKPYTSRIYFNWR